MNTPKIRFKGFKDDWEQRKLGEVAEYRNGKAHENEIDEDGEYIVVNSKFVSTNAEIRKFSNAQNEPLYENEIAFVLSDVPNGRAIARTFLVDKSGKYTLNQRIAGITPHEDTDPYYLHIRMNRNAYFLKFDDGNKQTNLSIKDVLNYEDMYPSYKEQHKIGSYFRQLDHIITLHQRKCDETKQLKKFMLQKMFPKNGEKNPKIRFEGFTDDWEQRKLGALMEDGIILEQSDGNHGELYPRSEEFVNEGIPYIAASSISSDGERIDFNLTKYLSMERAIQFRKGVAKNGDVLLAHNATVGPSVMLSMDYEFAILSTSLTLYRLDKEKMSPMFFLQAIRSGYFQKQLEVFMKQTTRSQVPILTQRNLQISYPINKVEQERIGEFLSNLDHLITLHQRKCEKLKALKKFMLQNMFI